MHKYNKSEEAFFWTSSDFFIDGEQCFRLPLPKWTPNPGF